MVQMKEIGEITDVDRGVATVRIQRNPSCGSCTACGMGKNQKEMFLKVSNDLGAGLGDWVELDLEAVSLLKASAIVYLIPLIGLIIGVGLGYLLASKFSGNAELYGALGGILLTVLSFLGIKALDPVFSKKGEYSPKMISIINSYSKGENVDGQ